MHKMLKFYKFATFVVSSPNWEIQRTAIFWPGRLILIGWETVP
jgi:hypothetical protein